MDLNTLIGQKRGRFTILSAWREDDGKIMSKCRCDCGNQKVVVYSNLRPSRVNSCGCTRAERIRAAFKKRKTDPEYLKLKQERYFDPKTLVGQKVGTAQILDAWYPKNYEGHTSRISVTFRCECGKEEIKALNILQKRPYCKYHFKAIDLKDIIGQKYNHCTILEAWRDKKIKNNVMVRYRCDCGNEAVSAFNHIKHGRTLSCGCMSAQYITEHFDEWLGRVDNTVLTRLQGSTKIDKRNKSGCRGVCRDKTSGKWKAYISLSKKRYILGFFVNLDDAIAARKAAEHKYYEPMLAKHGIEFKEK
ncbi:MAG: hypothetical protein LBR25_08520 [Erysipelotrichaceae bacterium]|nr:hypothetical protein [Erysipelotrichaceae bacterium]